MKLVGLSSLAPWAWIDVGHDADAGKIPRRKVEANPGYFTLVGYLILSIPSSSTSPQQYISIVWLLLSIVAHSLELLSASHALILRV
jgi:hypothetical protein